jgi:hypothetical protein
MVHHSLEEHVLPQVSVFANAQYDLRVAEHLLAQSAALDGPRLAEMIKGDPPKVLVVANDHSDEWDRDLRRYGVRFASVKVYRSDLNRYAFMCTGTDIDMPHASLTRCRRDPNLPMLLKVESPAALHGHGERLGIRWGGVPTEWIKISTDSDVWLKSARRDPMPPDENVFVLAEDDVGLHFEVSQKGRST